MSSAEMTIRLIDGSEDSQAAFDRPPNDNQPSNVPTVESVGRSATSDAPNASSVPAISTSDASGKQRVDVADASSVPSRSDSVAGLSQQLDELLGHLRAKTEGGQDTNFLANTHPEQFARDVAGFQQEIAKSATNRDSEKTDQTSPTEKPSDSSNDSLRDIRNSISDLVRNFSPKWLSDPIDRLIAAILPDKKKAATSSSTSDGSAAATATTRNGTQTATVPAFSAVAPQTPQAIVPAVSAVAPQTPQAIVPAVSAVAPQTPQAIVPAVSAVAVPSVQTPQPVTPPPDQSTPLVSRVASAGRRGKAFVKSTLQRSIPGKQVLRGYRRMRSLAKAGAKRLGKTRIGRGVASAGRRVANSSIGQGFASLVGGTTAATAAAAAGGGGGAVAATAATAGATVAMIAAPIVASVAAVVAFSMAVRNATEDLTEFSPEISAAKARGEVNTAMNRLDRSERIGPKLGQLEDAKNRFNDQTQKLLTDILALGLKFTPIFEAGINTLTLIASTAATAANVIEHGLAAKDVGLALLTPGKEDDKAAAERVAAATQQTKDIALGVAAAAAELFGYRNPEKRDEDLQRLLDLAPVPQRRKMRNP